MHQSLPYKTTRQEKDEKGFVELEGIEILKEEIMSIDNNMEIARCV